jgi:hypothetical protein
MEAGLGTHTNPPVRNLTRHHYSLPQKPSGNRCASALVHCTFGYCEEGLLQRCRSAGRGDNDWTKRRHCDHAARLVARTHYLFFEVFGLNGKKYFMLHRPRLTPASVNADRAPFLTDAVWRDAANELHINPTHPQIESAVLNHIHIEVPFEKHTDQGNRILWSCKTEPRGTGAIILKKSNEMCSSSYNFSPTSTIKGSITF